MKTQEFQTPTQTEYDKAEFSPVVRPQKARPEWIPAERFLPKDAQPAAPQTIVVSKKQNKVWNSLSDRQRKVMATLIASGATLAAMFGVYWLVKRQLKIIRANNAKAQSFGGTKHDTWANQFKQAFENDGWWGTDVPLVRRTLKSIPSKADFKKVGERYQVLTQGRILEEDLNDELSKTEYEEMLAIKNALPETSKTGQPAKIYDPKGWAKRIHAALSYTWLFNYFPGTDEEAVLEVFSEIPTQAAFWATAKAYNNAYQAHIWEDLDGDLDWSVNWRELLHKKPKK